MRRITRVVTALSLAAGLFATTQAQAHGIWFAERARNLALIYGIGADDLDSLKRISMFQDVAAWDASFKPLTATLKPSGPLVLVDIVGDATVVSGVMENGIWSKTPEGEWLKKGRDEVPNATVAEHTMKFGVRILKPLTAEIPPLPHHTLQIVPVGGKVPAMAGEPLKVRVLYKGKPQAGVPVRQDWVTDPDGKQFTTGADGTVELPVRNQGLNVVTAVFKGPADDPKKVDHVEYTASLSFVLEHAPE